MTELDAKRQLVARMITAENDLIAIKRVYYGLLRRQFHGHPADDVPWYIGKLLTMTYLNYEWARKDVKAFQG